MFKRFQRWARKGVFDCIFRALSENFDLEYAGVDGTVVQAHAKAPGGKGGRFAGDRAIQRGGSAARIAALVDAGLPGLLRATSGRGARPGGHDAAARG